MSSNRADRSLSSRAPLSITARLTILYALSAAVVLLLNAGLLFWIAIRDTEQDDFHFVVDKFYRLERALEDHSRDPSVLDREIKWQGGFHGVEQDHTFYSRVLDDRGRVVIETAGMEKVFPSAQFPSPVAPATLAGPKAVQYWRSPEGRSYCVLAAQARSEPGGRSWVIQVAMDDEADQRLIWRYRRATLTALVLAIIVSSALGGLVARRGLKPLREIADTTERITANQLNERIDPTSCPRELRSVANSLNRMLCRLEKSFDRMSRFAADVAHDLREPIHNMMLGTEVALADKRNPEEYRNLLESNLEEFDRLSRMINDMLFLARAENPNSQIKRVRLDARREIEAVREFFDALIESRGVEVSAQGQGDIDADPLLFRRATTNLLSNALRHTPSGGTIVLAVEPGEDNTVLVKVADSGCGIPTEDLAKICERRDCADRIISPVSDHIGLGLSIAKSIVELHGGSIAIDSVLGKGTTVALRFPAAAPVAA